MTGKNSVSPIISSASGGGTMSPVTMCSSEWHSPATFHSTSTSPALGGSTSISSTFQSSPIPHSTAALAFTRVPLVVSERG